MEEVTTAQEHIGRSQRRRKVPARFQDYLLLSCEEPVTSLDKDALWSPVALGNIRLETQNYNLSAHLSIKKEPISPEQSDYSQEIPIFNEENIKRELEDPEYDYTGTESSTVKKDSRELTHEVKSGNLGAFKNIDNILKDNCNLSRYAVTCNNAILSQVKNINQQLRRTSETKGTFDKRRVSFICHTCNFSCTTKGYLKFHIDSKHRGVKHPCPHCGALFRHKSSIGIHIKAKHEGALFSCPHCSHKANELGNLKKHIKGQHEGYTYQCPHCDHRAAVKANLLAHIEGRHQGVTHPCLYCSYRTSDRRSLRRHVDNIHKGVKFSCPHCDYEAKIKVRLRAHFDSVHRGIFYECVLCSYTTIYQDNLSCHLKKKHKDIQLLHPSGPWKPLGKYSVQTNRSKHLTCAYCNCKIRKKKDIRLHIHRKHSKCL